MALTVRASEPAEKDRLLEITLAAYGEFAQVMRPRHWEAYRRHIVDTLSDTGAAEQLVAIVDRSIMGSVLLYPPGTSFTDDVEASMSDDCPEVRLLAVAPEGRGLGVGRALMEACVERAERSGAPGIVLHTMAMMAAARRIYDRLGFVRAPDLDFRPAQDWIVEGFRLDLQSRTRVESRT